MIRTAGSNPAFSIVLLAVLCGVSLAAQPAGGRGPQTTYWVAKGKGGVYVAPNHPLTRLADLKARHTGQAVWKELVVKDPEIQAEYNAAVTGTVFSPRFHPDTASVAVVVEGEMRFEIEGQSPILASRGSIVNILKGTLYSFEITGSRSGLWVEINPVNFQTLYPANIPLPVVPGGMEMVQVAFSRAPLAYAAPNLPHWNLFEAAKKGPPGGARVAQDHLFLNPIYGFAEPNYGGAAPFNPQSIFGHMHPGPAEWWIVQSGQITAKFENAGEFVGSEGDILYAPPMTWHQMGFRGAGPSCRLAIGAYSFINMNSTPGGTADR